MSRHQGNAQSGDVVRHKLFTILATGGLAIGAMLTGFGTSQAMASPSPSAISSSTSSAPTTSMATPAPTESDSSPATSNVPVVTTLPAKPTPTVHPPSSSASTKQQRSAPTDDNSPSGQSSIDEFDSEATVVCSSQVGTNRYTSLNLRVTGSGAKPSGSTFRFRIYDDDGTLLVNQLLVTKGSNVSFDGVVSAPRGRSFLVGNDYIDEVTNNEGESLQSSAVIPEAMCAKNNAPRANPDSASTNQDTAVTINVLKNDTDEDGDTLSVATFGKPAHGTTALSGKKIVYTPASGFSGTDSFTYTAGDGKDGSNIAKVTVIVKPSVIPPKVKTVDIDQNATSAVCGDPRATEQHRVTGNLSKVTLAITVNGKPTSANPFKVYSGQGYTITATVKDRTHYAFPGGKATKTLSGSNTEKPFSCPTPPTHYNPPTPLNPPRETGVLGPIGSDSGSSGSGKILGGITLMLFGGLAMYARRRRAASKSGSV